MCGITGRIGKSVFDFQKFTDAIKHRGPNADGFYLNNLSTVELGHRRLSILDLSTHANQPMESACGRYVIVFNGEVYNFKELQQEYNLTCSTTSDTEVILELFVKVGVKTPALLNGMFAFAIYDKQNDTTFIARDHIGIKPLFYSLNTDGFTFSSELKSFKAIDFPLSINKNAIPYFLHVGYIPQPLTIYNEIHKFPAGHYVIIESKNIKFNPIEFWSVESATEKEVICDENQAFEQLKVILDRAITKQLVSDVPIGTFLSGGIDSSLVTAIAAKNAKIPIQTFSIGFHEADLDESQYAEKIAAHLGTKHHTFKVSQNEILPLVSELLDVYDEPFGDSSAFPTMLVSKLAKQHVTVTLGGDGGDELFFGYGMYTWAERLAKNWVPIARKPIVLISQLLPNRYKRAAQVFDYSSKENIKSHIFSQEQYLFSENELKSLLLIPKNSFSVFNNIKSSRELSASELQSFWDLEHYLKDDLLVKVDRATMHYSLETRVPLLDIDLIKFSLNLHPTLKKQNGVSKYLLKKVLFELVPKELFDRPKKGFSIPLVKWLKEDLRFLQDEYLSEKVILQFGFVKYESVKQLQSKFNNGESFLYNRIWHLIVLHWWLVKNSNN